MEIWLIRHGDTEGYSQENFSKPKNRFDPALNDKGIGQAEMLAHRLIGCGLQMIYASDLVRAVQTAEIINSTLNLPIETRAELREIDMGRLHHCSWEDIQREDPDICAQWHRHESDLPYPGGECGADAAKRTMKVIDKIVESGYEKVAVVCHGGIIRVALCAVLGIGQEKRFQFGPPENTSISVIRVDGEKKDFSVYSVNDAGHLV